MWFSLISTASYRPMRWLAPPPTRTAYFCASRRPGSVLRVSTICARGAAHGLDIGGGPGRHRTEQLQEIERRALGREQARAAPAISSTTWSGAQRAPSSHMPVMRASGSICRSTASTQGAPHITAGFARQHPGPRAPRSENQARPSDRQPPTSSSSARACIGAHHGGPLGGRKIESTVHLHHRKREAAHSSEWARS